VAIQDDIPRSRINLRYRTNIKGDGELLELPFRLLVLGDLSLGSSKDREVDLDTRRMRALDGKNLDGVMEDMQMSLHFKVDNFIDNTTEEGLSVDLPIHNRKSFLPDHVADHVPKIRSLLLLRRLLIEMQSNIDNRKELRRTIQEIFSNPEALESLKKELAAYSGYEVPNTKALAAKPAEPAGK
jgi:type VI secretion system protein ImpB